ncbi:MAG TPA: hypothetical protein VEX40_02515 [Mycobacterium sp.]|nr:hypothetical protein [Mycobacterium sp.]
MTPLEPLDRLAIQDFRGVAIGEQCSAPSFNAERKVGASGLRRGGETIEGVACKVSIASSQGGFDQFGQRPLGEPGRAPWSGGSRSVTLGLRR